LLEQDNDPVVVAAVFIDRIDLPSFVRGLLLDDKA